MITNIFLSLCLGDIWLPPTPITPTEVTMDIFNALPLSSRVPVEPGLSHS